MLNVLKRRAATTRLALLTLSTVSLGAVSTAAQAATPTVSYSSFSFFQSISFSAGTSSAPCASPSNTGCTTSWSSYSFFQSISYYYYNSGPGGVFAGGFLQNWYQSWYSRTSPTGTSFDYKSLFQQTVWNYALPSTGGSSSGGGSSSSDPLVSWMSGNLGASFAPAAGISGLVS